ncbi:MAG: GNAT family N-acetyltransferase [Bacillota bacterium]
MGAPVVKLRGPTAEDLTIVAQWHSDPEYLKMVVPVAAIPGPPPNTATWIEQIAHDSRNRTLAIEVDGRFAGVVELQDIDWKNRSGEYGIEIGLRDFQRKGIGYEASRQFFDFVFDEMGLHRVSVKIFEFNKPAIKAVEGWGFTHEGRLSTFSSHASVREESKQGQRKRTFQ